MKVKIKYKYINDDVLILDLDGDIPEKFVLPSQFKKGVFFYGIYHNDKLIKIIRESNCNEEIIERGKFISNLTFERWVKELTKFVERYNKFEKRLKDAEKESYQEVEIF